LDENRVSFVIVNCSNYVASDSSSKPC